VAPKNTGRAATSDGDVPTIAVADGRYVRQGGGVAAIVSGTQAQYDALATKDPNTLYVIVG
jgi:hypothetical protein